MLSKHITLSIVIPHYNVAPYIDTLYNSLLPQLTDNIELILIEDCSKDLTKEKIQDWEKKITHPHTRFIYLEKNVGLSEARNIGLDNALGTYVWFIDSDDYIASDTTSTLVELLDSYSPDGIVFDFIKFKDEKTQQRSKWRSLQPNQINQNSEMLLQTLFNDAQMYVWCYVLKKTLWQKYPFPIGKKFEDITVMPKIMYDVTSLYYLPKPFYYYRQRENSILSAPTVESCFNINDAMKQVYLYFRDLPLSEQTRMSLYVFYFKTLRLSYGTLRKHHLLSSEVYKNYQKEEKYFFDILPFSPYRFIFKMKIYPAFKITSFLFLINKNLYFAVKSLIGRY